MSQRFSGFERIENDLYETPAWVTDCLFEALPSELWPRGGVFEPAAGSGKMVRALHALNYAVVPNDIQDHGLWGTVCDFFFFDTMPISATAIITNPPYGKQNRLAVKFIEHALKLTKQKNGFVAMLLPADFDHAGGRRHLFADHPAFMARIAVQRRIKWIEGSTGSPSQNHTWFVWSWSWGHPGRPLCLYAR